MSGQRFETAGERLPTASLASAPSADSTRRVRRPTIVLGPMAGKVWLSKTGTVRFDDSKCPALTAVAGPPAEVDAHAERIVFRQDGVGVADHARALGRGQKVHDPWRHVPVLERKPGALRNGATFRAWMLPRAMTAIRRKPKGRKDGDRQMVLILTGAPDDGLQAVEAGCRKAVAQGV